jgi:hypothetical protein
MKELKLARLVGKTKSLKVSPNICLAIHGFGTFGLVIFKLVHKLIFNPLLLFHHVVHIPKYSFFELK